MNLNDTVYIQLTDYGRGIFAEKNKEFLRIFPNVPEKVAQYFRQPKKEDSDGWSEWQLWHLMETFGPHMQMGMNLPFETEIKC